MNTITSAKKIMTPHLITIPTGTLALEADEIMREKKIRHLPVVGDNGDIVGVVSQRDLNGLNLGRSLVVDRIMNSPVHFVPQDTPLRQVIFHMLEKKISSLLVADLNDNAIGIVTTDDLLWYLASLISKDPSPEKSHIFSPKTQYFIGEVANEISQMGI